MAGATDTTRFEHAEPILRVSDMGVSVRYYTNVLGFGKADWSTDDFAFVSRDGAGIYLCRGSLGQPGTWAWVGGRSKSMWKTRMGMSCASVLSHSQIDHSMSGPSSTARSSIHSPALTCVATGPRTPGRPHDAGTRAERLFRASSVSAFSLLELPLPFHAAKWMASRISVSYRWQAES
jgi:hypothetical protein